MTLMNSEGFNAIFINKITTWSFQESGAVPTD